MAVMVLRGLVPSLGAGGSLVGAALVAVAVLSSIVAFQGWPDAGAAAREGTLTLGAPSPVAAAHPPRATVERTSLARGAPARLAPRRTGTPAAGRRAAAR